MLARANGNRRTWLVETPQLIFILAVAVITTGCSKAKSERPVSNESPAVESSYWHSQKIQVIAAGLSTADEALIRAAKPESEWTRLTADVWGLTQWTASELRELHPGIRAFANRYVPPHLRKKSKVHEIEWKLFGHNEGFGHCRKSNSNLTLAAEFLRGDRLATQNVFQINETLRIQLKTPQALTNAGVLSWRILTPQESLLGQLSGDDDEIYLEPDATGLYELIALVSYPDGTCLTLESPFAVSSNPQDMRAQISRATPELSQFKHLKHLQVPAAWQIGRGENIRIAIVDTGVNYQHFELAGQIELNLSEIPNNGIDDDQNGLVDDYLGYDFVNDDAYPFDDEGHGSQVAGLAAATSFGVAPLAKIIPVKVMNPNGSDFATITRGIQYAIDRGAHIINLSLGALVVGNDIGASDLPELSMLEAVIQAAEQQGIIVVCASGNGEYQRIGDGINIDRRNIKSIPASINFANVITVAAHDFLNPIAAYSNWGPVSVDVVAPGGSMLDPLISTYKDNPQHIDFTSASGTSMAAAITSGTLALMMSAAPNSSVAALRHALLNSGQQQPQLIGKVVSPRHMDTLNAVELLLSR